MNPKLIATLFQVLTPLAITGGVGYALYKGVDNFFNSFSSAKARKQGVDNVNNLDYIYANSFLALFTDDAWSYSKQKIIDLVKQAQADGVNWHNVAKFYAQLTKGRDFYGECAIVCNRHYDSSGNFLAHLREALSDRFLEVADIITV